MIGGYLNCEIRVAYFFLFIFIEVLQDSKINIIFVHSITIKFTKMEGKKLYSLMYSVGKAKYLVSYHDGIKTHKDKSPFFDIATFSNKKKMILFINNLKKSGYEER